MKPNMLAAVRIHGFGLAVDIELLCMSEAESYLLSTT